MVRRMPTHCGDDMCASCVVAGDTIYLSHHAGGFDRQDIAHQTRSALFRMQETLASVGASMDDVVQVHYYIRNIEDFRTGADVFGGFFLSGPPARMTTTSAFVDPRCLCQVDGIAYRPLRRV